MSVNSGRSLVTFDQAVVMASARDVCYRAREKHNTEDFSYFAFDEFNVETFGLPVVSVPVLSTTSVVVACDCSKASMPLMRSP